MADYQQAHWDRFQGDRQTDEWFLRGVQAAVWSQEPLKTGDLWEGETPRLSLEEKKQQLRERMETLWPKPQP